MIILLDGSFSGDTRIYCPRCFDSGNIVSIEGIHSCIPLKDFQYYIIIPAFFKEKMG